MKNNTNSLEQEIRASFHCSVSETVLTNEEADDLIYDIVSLDNESVKRFLPILLLRSIPGHLDGDKDRSDLVILLDGALLKKQKDGSWDSKPEKYRYELNYSYEMYSSFSVAESQAILRWLNEIAISKYDWRFCSNHIISAIIFWQSIMKKLRPPTHFSLSEMAKTRLEELLHWRKEMDYLF